MARPAVTQVSRARLLAVSLRAVFEWRLARQAISPWTGHRGSIRRRMPPLQAPPATDPCRELTADLPKRHWRAVCRERHLQPAATRSDREMRHALRQARPDPFR